MATPVEQFQPDTLGGGMPPPEPPEETALVYEVASIPLSEDEESRLVKDTMGIVQKGDDAFRPLKEKLKTSRLQYESRLSREDTADDWESDVDIPITYERCSALNARVVNPILQEDPIYTAKPRPDLNINENAVFAQRLEPYMDSIVDTWKFPEFCDDALVQAETTYTAIVKVPFVRQTRSIKEWVRKVDPYTGMETSVLEEREYVIREGAIPEVCHTEDVCWWPARSPDVNACQAIWHTIYMAPHEVRNEIKNGFFLDRYEQLRLVDRRASDTAPAGNPDSRLAVLEPTHYEIKEVYRTWEKRSQVELEDGTLSSNVETHEIIVWIDAGSETLLRAVYNPFSEYHRPFFFFPWERRLNELIGFSLCERMEDIHRAVSASFNQRLEAAALANAVAWGTDDDDLADMFEDKKIRPGQVNRLTGMPKEHLMEMKLSQPYTQLPQLEEMLEMHADKVVGTNAYTFGIEQIERPTATGQTKLMQEGQMPLSAKVRRFRDFLAEIMYCVLARHKQMFPHGSRYWTRDENGNLREDVMEFPLGPIDLRVAVEIKASEAAWDKNAQKQDAVALLDRLKDSYTVLGGMVQAAAMPSPAAPAMLKMAVGFSAALRNLLVTFEVPNVEELVPDLQQEVLGGQFLFQQLQALAQQNAQLQTALLGPGGVPAGPGLPGGGGEGPGGAPQGGAPAPGGPMGQA